MMNISNRASLASIICRKRPIAPRLQTVVRRHAGRPRCGRITPIFEAVVDASGGDMARGPAESLTPAEVAEMLGIPPSTLRTYATEFGSLLSAGAQGDLPGVGRAFRHRRYSHNDLAVLTRAKTLLDAGLSYLVALAQLAGDGLGAVTDERKRRSPP